MTNINALFTGLDTEPSHRRALNILNRTLPVQKIKTVILSVLFKLAVFCTLTTALFGTAAFFFPGEKQMLFAMLPEFAVSALSFVTELWQWLFETVCRFGTGDVPGVIITDALLLLVFPALTGLGGELLAFLVIRCGNRNASATLSIYYDNTYRYLQGKYIYDYDKMYHSRLPVYLANGLFLLAVGAYVFLSAKTVGPKLIVGALAVLVFGLPLSTLPFRFLAFLYRPLYQLHRCIAVNDLTVFEDAYAAVDRYFGRQLSVRRQSEQAQEQQDRERKAQQHAERIEKETSKPKLRFRAGGIAAGNFISVFVDGEMIARFDGGQIQTVRIEPGYHKVMVQIQNEAAEQAYWLDTIARDFKAHKTYDIDYK